MPHIWLGSSQIQIVPWSGHTEQPAPLPDEPLLVDDPDALDSLDELLPLLELLADDSDEPPLGGGSLPLDWLDPELSLLTDELPELPSLLLGDDELPLLDPLELLLPDDWPLLGCDDSPLLADELAELCELSWLLADDSCEDEPLESLGVLLSELPLLGGGGSLGVLLADEDGGLGGNQNRDRDDGASVNGAPTCGSGNAGMYCQMRFRSVSS